MRGCTFILYMFIKYAQKIRVYCFNVLIFML